MHIGEDILTFQKRIKQTSSVITFHQRRILIFAGNGIQLDPDFQHASGFKIQDIIHLIPAEIFGPIIKPVRKILGYFKSNGITRIFVHIQQAHKNLVDGVMRSPNLFALSDAVQIFFRDGSRPFAAILFLAFSQLLYQSIRLGLKFPVARGMIMHGGSGQPVPQKMPPQLTGGKLPASMHAFDGFRRCIPA